MGAMGASAGSPSECPMTLSIPIALVNAGRHGEKLGGDRVVEGLGRVGLVEGINGREPDR